MKRTNRIETVHNDFMHALTAGVLVGLAAILALTALIGLPTGAGTQEVLAWHCESMTATPESIIDGESATLSWVFAADSDITVTIDQLPGQSWDGTEGSVEVTPTETTTYTAVAHKVGTDTTFECSVTVTVEPLKVPSVPICPFVASDALTVIDFNGGKSREDASVLLSTNPNHYEIEESVMLGAGTYSVQTASWDGYHNRVNVSQPHEQWNVEVRGLSVLGTAGETTDIADYVREDTKVDMFVDAVVLSEESTSVAAVHAYQGHGNANSVVPVCIAFEKKIDEPQQPVCSMSADPTSVEEGQASTVTWSSDNTVSASFDNAIIATTTSGSAGVSPATTTTYTGTFVGTDDSTITCNATVTVYPPNGDPDPVCAMSIAPSKVTSSGASATLTWSSDHVTSATIDNSIGSVEVNGSQSITVNTATTYTGIFTADDGRSVTCAAAVTVGGGGGKCLNCVKEPEDPEDPEDPEPTIVLSKTVTKAGSFITLDQVPYTGFEAGPVLTLLFWLAVLLVSALIAYAITHMRPLEKIRAAIANEPKTKPVVPNNMVHDGSLMQVAQPASPTAAVATDDAPALGGVKDNGVGLIEEKAHKDNILLSPETTRMIMRSLQGVDISTDEFLNMLFANVKATYPREDGWILLSKERMEVLLQRDEKAPETNVNRNTHAAESIEQKQDAVTETLKQHPQHRAVPPKLAARPVPVLNRDTVSEQAYENEHKEKADTNEIVPAFVGSLVAGEQKHAFDLLRKMTSQGVSTEAFIGRVVRKLDDIYKNRIEGNHNPDPQLAAKTATWSNADFEHVLGMLVECIDYSYSSTRIGTKVALAKVFEHFEKVNKRT